MKLEKKNASVNVPVEQDQTTWYKNRKIQTKIAASIALALLATLPLWEPYIQPDLYIGLNNLLEFVINILDV